MFTFSAGRLRWYLLYVIELWESFDDDIKENKYYKSSPMKSI